MRADAQERRNNIIATAIRLFQQRGEQVALDEIAQQAGVGIATLYRNFPDRTALVHACTQHLAEDFLAFQRELNEQAENALGAAQIPNLPKVYAQRLLSIGLETLIPAFVPADLDDLPPALLQLRGDLIAEGARFIRICQERGQIGLGVTHLEFVVGVLALARSRGVNVETYQPDIQARMLDLYLHGLRHGHES